MTAGDHDQRRERRLARLIEHATGADRAEFDALFAQLHTDIKRLAKIHLDREFGNRTLTPTALIGIVWEVMSTQRNLRGADRTTFLSAAAATIRRALIDHARRRKAHKRGGGRRPGLLGSDQPAPSVSPGEVLLALDDALEQLRRHDARQAAVVEMRFFAQLPEQTIAEALDVSPRTVQIAWANAKVFLARQLVGAWAAPEEDEGERAGT